MQICSAWRQIAISMRVLWTTFHVNLEDRGSEIVDIAEIWLNRARGCPLSVRIAGLSRVEIFGTVMTILGQHSSRIQSFGLELTVPDLAKLNECTLELPWLQELAITLNDVHQRADLIRLFNNAPLLRKVELAGIQPASIGLPWQQLNEFTGRSYLDTDCSEALRCMPNITRCKFRLLFEDDRDLISGPYIHPKLEHLHIVEAEVDSAEDSEAESPPHMLQFLTLPALRTLELSNSGDLESQVLDSFFRLSSPPLRKLLFRPGYTYHLSSMCLLKKLEELTHLEFSCSSSTWISNFFDAFASDASFLPRLRNLSIQQPFDLTSFINSAGIAVKKRRELQGTSPLQLQSLRLVVLDSRKIKFNISESELVIFRELRDSGIEIHIGSKSKSVI